MLRLYGLYGNKRLVYGLVCLMILALGADIYIIAVLEPPFSANPVPGIGVLCAPGTGDVFGLIWYVLMAGDLP